MRPHAFDIRCWWSDRERGRRDNRHGWAGGRPFSRGSKGCFSSEKLIALGWEYVYDALSRRVEKTVNGTTAKFVYDLAGRTLTQFDSSGNWQRVELYAGGAHLATWTPSHTYFPHTNLVGSERVRTDEQGAVAEDCKYLNYGELESCTGTAYSPIHYAGYERDSETGLDHMWFRYYNPRLGRFMTTDPLSGSAGDPQSLNKFGYVLGNPEIGRAHV